MGKVTRVEFNLLMIQLNPGEQLSYLQDRTNCRQAPVNIISLLELFKFIKKILLKDIFWFLLYININQPQVYIWRMETYTLPHVKRREIQVFNLALAGVGGMWLQIFLCLVMFVSISFLFFLARLSLFWSFGSRDQAFVRAFKKICVC